MVEAKDVAYTCYFSLRELAVKHGYDPNGVKLRHRTKKDNKHSMKRRMADSEITWEEGPEGWVYDLDFSSSRFVDVVIISGTSIGFWNI